DPWLKSFLRLTPERALEEARRAEQAWRRRENPGPLCGVPYAVKYLFDVRGVPTTAGTRLRKNAVAGSDSWAVHRLTRAGMVLLGKTQTVQFAYGGVGINHDQGTPLNPWKRIPHVPGGSSSGSAVAVASGLVPAALGTDTGGSVRIPAALCGIVGLKTTVGRVGRSGVYPLSFRLDSIGPLARSVQDAALVGRELQGIDPGDETTHPVPLADWSAGLKAGLAGLRLGLVETVFSDQADPEVEASLREAETILGSAGAMVESLDLPEAAEVIQNPHTPLITAAEACVVNHDYLERHFDELDPVIARRMVKGRQLSAVDYLSTWKHWEVLRTRVRRRLQGFDALIVPTTPIAAAPLEAVDLNLESYYAYNARYLRNTFIGNVLNLCAVSVPCGFTRQGLPLGLMIYAQPFEEALALRIAFAYEQATDWHRRRPDLSWIA
ncbi:MAG TPA: amidase, partial [Thermodesulfobacteriota bacterium]|nr:amidase [Thermodesulfobacteriota bacterium]